MSLFETQIDCDFVYAVQSLAKSADDIAKSLKNAELKEAYSDEQVKEIIKSYPKEDLYELLNFDQRVYVEEQERIKDVFIQTRGQLFDEKKFYERVRNCTNEEFDSIATQVARLLVEEHKYDKHLDYWSNIDNQIKEVLQKEGY